MIVLKVKRKSNLRTGRTNVHHNAVDGIHASLATASIEMGIGGHWKLVVYIVGGFLD